MLKTWSWKPKETKACELTGPINRPSDNSDLQWLPVRSGQHLLVPVCVLLKFIPWIWTASTTPSREPTNVGFYHSSPWGPVNLLGLLIEHKCMVTVRSMTNFKTAEEKSLRPVWMMEPQMKSPACMFSLDPRSYPIMIKLHANDWEMWLSYLVRG